MNSVCVKKVKSIHPPLFPLPSREGLLPFKKEMEELTKTNFILHHQVSGDSLSPCGRGLGRGVYSVLLQK